MNITSSEISFGDKNWISSDFINLALLCAGLFHDFGKASVGFQEKLRGKSCERSAIRHEVVSACIFECFVRDSGKTDAGFFARLSRCADSGVAKSWLGNDFFAEYLNGSKTHFSFANDLPPFCAFVYWLILTHHRLPVRPVLNVRTGELMRPGSFTTFDELVLDGDFSRVGSLWNNDLSGVEDSIAECWSFDVPESRLPFFDASWQRSASRVGRQGVLLTQKYKEGLSSFNSYGTRYIARLIFILADHFHSSKDISYEKEKKCRIFPDSLFANTRKGESSDLKELLSDHLVGVAGEAARISFGFEIFASGLPSLSRCKALRRRSGRGVFMWQDRGVDRARAFARTAEPKSGAFVVSMASTGCGKTLANAKIMMALSPEGMRLTYAIGLRSLTRQTGVAYRHDIGLSDKDLAVLVGGPPGLEKEEWSETVAAMTGSESSEDLTEGGYCVEGGLEVSDPVVGRVLSVLGSSSASRMLGSPVLVCTVDHLAPSTEKTRGGGHVLPGLRLMSSDLVFDELDDYSLDDLPALVRLVRQAGLSGSKVIISSATLPEVMVEGMYRAYCEGRKEYEKNFLMERPGSVYVLWCDEFSTRSRSFRFDDTGFSRQHRAFVEKRVQRLSRADVLRRGEIIPIPKDLYDFSDRTVPRDASERSGIVEGCYAGVIRNAVLKAHLAHSSRDPVSERNVSIGVVRMSNVNRIIGVALKLLALGGFSSAETSGRPVRIHLCVYHARFFADARSGIEAMLDTVFNRKKEEEFWKREAIRSAVDSDPGSDHVFVVLASPVCETGRDWDSDWVVVEPSSMRSLVQMAGRVQRHRKTPCLSPNVFILEKCFRFIFRKAKFSGSRVREEGSEVFFSRPGFEREGRGVHELVLHSHAVGKIIPQSFLERIDSRFRIMAGWVPSDRVWRGPDALSGLEIEATARVFGQGQIYKVSIQEDGSVCWRYPDSDLTGMLAQCQPFRKQMISEVVVVLRKDYSESSSCFFKEDAAFRSGAKSVGLVSCDKMVRRIELPQSNGVSLFTFYGNASKEEERTTELQSVFASVFLPRSEKGWEYHYFLGFRSL